MSNILVTYNNGIFYRGNSTMSSDILFKYRNNKVYKGNSFMTSDIMLTTETKVHPIYILLVLL